MADTRRRTAATYNRQTADTASRRRKTNYVEGNTVRQFQAVPATYEPKRKEAPRRRTSEHARKNREKALHMTAGYVIFLTGVVFMVMLACIQYIQLRTENTNLVKSIASLESQVLEVKAENDALENNLLSSINLENIKEIAINELGMRYPGSEQIITYGSSDSDYVRQYQSIPQAD